MRRTVKSLILELLSDYYNIPSYIKEREEEIKHPIIPDDDNVGGGRPLNKIHSKTENLVITLNDDARLNKLKREHDVITSCYENAGPDTKTIVRELCFKDRAHQVYTMQGLYFQGKIHVGPTKGYKLRNRFIKEVAHGLGFDTY